MNFSKEIKNNYLIIKPSGKIDATNSDDFTESLKKLLENKNKIIINFEDIDYISSAGLRSILIIAKEAKNRDGKLVLCSLKEHIMEIFEITGFTKMINIVNTLQDAEKIINIQ